MIARAKDPDHWIIRGIAVNHPTGYRMDSVQLEQLIKAGKIEVFREIGAYYSGTTISDDICQPYLSICENMISR